MSIGDLCNLRGYTYLDVFQCSRVICEKAGPRNLNRRDAEEEGATTAVMELVGRAMRCAIMATGFFSYLFTFSLHLRLLFP